MNLDKWEKTRKKGKNRFIWINGVLGWGVTTAILWSSMMEVFEPSEEIWVRPLIALVVFSIGGIAFGHLIWNQAEKKYAQRKSEQGT